MGLCLPRDAPDATKRGPQRQDGARHRRRPPSLGPALLSQSRCPDVPRHSQGAHGLLRTSSSAPTPHKASWGLWRPQGRAGAYARRLPEGGSETSHTLPAPPRGRPCTQPPAWSLPEAGRARPLGGLPTCHHPSGPPSRLTLPCRKSGPDKTQCPAPADTAVTGLPPTRTSRPTCPAQLRGPSLGPHPGPSHPWPRVGLANAGDQQEGGGGPRLWRPPCPATVLSGHFLLRPQL